MDATQQNAIDTCFGELVSHLESNVEPLLNHLEVRQILTLSEREICQSLTTSASQLVYLLKLLKWKDNGWSSLVSYLTANKYAKLAGKLLSNTDEIAELPDSTSCGECANDLDRFCTELAQYYQSHYANLWTLWGDPKHVKDVWVPLEVEEKTKILLVVGRFGHEELLNRMSNSRNAKVAVVKGDPGVGKTTLAKKIAYDWAEKYQQNQISSNDFRLVLAVPLRSVGKANNFLRLAVDYLLEILQLEEVDKVLLLSLITKLGPKLLVCLDGLDEYQSYAESPFKVLFAAPFDQSSANSKSQPPYLPYKLMITSRPYACENLINPDFFPLRFTICSLADKHLEEFVQLYCQTQDGKDKVIDYVRNKVRYIVKVPLILTFICFLAETEVEIPANLTWLYDSFIRQMLRREDREKKLEEIVSIHNWKQTKVVQTTAQLAFEGCSEAKLIFDECKLHDNHVSNDSFICGFLLHKFDVVKESLKAEFPHRSIQEYFGAIHCYTLWSTGSKSARDSVMREICREDSQVGRFLFGMSSKDFQFSQLLQWVQPSYADMQMSNAGDVEKFLFFFDDTLTDCKDEEKFQFAQVLATTTDQIANLLRSHEGFLWGNTQIVLSMALETGFLRGLLIEQVAKPNDNYSGWLIPSANQPKCAKLLRLTAKLPADTSEVVESIKALWWSYGEFIKDLSLMPDANGLNVTTIQLNRLPPVHTALIQISRKINVEVNFSIDYKISETQTIAFNPALRYLIVGVDRLDVTNLELAAQSNQQQPFIVVKPIKDERLIGANGDKAVWLSVEVSQMIDQATLIEFLLNHAITICV